MTQSELSEFLDASAPCRFNASDIGEYQYKICDDSVRPRHFLGADNENGIEAIFSERKEHSLHEFIDDNEPLCPIIDFNLPVETLNTISPKLSDKQAKNILCNAFKEVCLEIFPDWDKKTITIADSSDVKKISLHVSTFGMRLPNIAQVAVFTELVRKISQQVYRRKALLIILQIKVPSLCKCLDRSNIRKKLKNMFV